MDQTPNTIEPAAQSPQPTSQQLGGGGTGPPGPPIASWGSGGIGGVTPTSSQEAKLETLINRATDSVLPPRVLLLLVVLCSIFAFFRCWNQSNTGWLNSRISALRCAVKWYGKQAPSNPKDTTDLLQYQVAQRVLQEMQPADQEQLKDLLKSLEENRTQNVRVISIPILGSTIDVNDLGLFSGLFLVLLLLMFCLSFDRERRNLELVFDRAAELDSMRGAPKYCENLRHCYEVMTMSQVAVVPPALRSRTETPFAWRHLTKIGLLFPIIVQAYIICFDIETFETGFFICHQATLRSILGNVCFTVLVIVFTWRAFQTWHSIDRLWLDRKNKLARSLE